MDSNVKYRQMLANPPQAELLESEENQIKTNWNETDLVKYIDGGPSGLLLSENLPQTIELSQNTSKSIHDMNETVLTPAFLNNCNQFEQTLYSYYPKDTQNNSLFADILLYRWREFANHIFIEESYPPEPELLMPILDHDRYHERNAQAYILIGPCGTLLALRTSKTMVLYGNPASPFYANEVIMPPEFKPNIIPPTSTGSVNAATRSMKQFLYACNWHRLAIYASQRLPSKPVISYKRIRATE